MNEPLPVRIASVDHHDGDAIIINLSDNTIITLTLDELLRLRPRRKTSPP